MKVSLILFFIIIFLNLFFSKSKFTFFLLNFYLFILMAFNNSIADRVTYKAIYVYPENYIDIDIGFQLLVKLSKLVGLNFQSFINLIFIISLLLIARIVLLLSDRPGIVSVLYCIYPFFNDAAQIRSFLGMALMISGVYYLFFAEKSDKLKFFLFLILAGSVHYTFFLFVFLLFLRNTEDILKVFKMILVSIATMLLLFPIILTVIRKFFPPIWVRISHYFDLSTSINTKIGVFMIFITTFMLVVFYMNKNIYTGDSNIYASKQYLNLNLFLFALFPLVFYSIEFLRLYRSMLIFNYILFSNTLGIRKKFIGKDLVMNTVLVCYFAVLFYYFDYSLIYDSIIIPLFEENTWLK
ncbi:hypothetical protein IGI65_001071 [Enterococcus sp. DIV0755b]|uniref:EpsG family protein n=1 Tax=Enterococcus sp. DIV0755b TaxID=2774657 RepID=UPI003F208C4E